MKARDLATAQRVYLTLPNPSNPHADGEKVYYDLVTRKARVMGGDGIACVQIRKAGDVFGEVGWYPVAGLRYDGT
jgi:hypothetical protein